MSDSAVERGSAPTQPAEDVEDGAGLRALDSAELAGAMELSTEAVIEHLGALTTMMRQLGAKVGVGELLAAHRALLAVDSSSRTEARLALRAVLCSGRADIPRFELAFLAVFGDGSVAMDNQEELPYLGEIEKIVPPRAAVPSTQPRSPSGDGGEDGEPDLVPAAWSEVEILGDKDFALYTDAEMAIARDLIARLARRGPTKLSRRLRPARRGHQPDVRRIVRSSLRTAGEPLKRHWRAPSRRPRQLVLVCDVSGSMSPYARMLLQYLHACVAARRRVEAFAFGTRLTRITNELAGRDHDKALDRAAEAVVDFSGGTRIGAALAELNRTHGRRIGRGAVIVILSDGWDRGEPEELEVEMARLRRSAHRVVWLNPLAAHPDFAPLTRGMRAAVPHTDELLAGNSLASLEELATILEEL